MQSRYRLKCDAVVDISPILTPFPQKCPRPHPIPTSFNPIHMKFVPIPIKSAVFFISADNLTVYRRH